VYSTIPEGQTPETIRSKKKLSAIGSTPKQRKPMTYEDWGYYLAGLIDGDGHISKQCQIVITFALNDEFLAQWIKYRLGFGSVRKIRNKSACTYVISDKRSIVQVFNLVNNKLRTVHKIERIQWLLQMPLLKDVVLTFLGDPSFNLDNWWLAGFFDADGSFQIKVVTRKNSRKEVRLNAQIDQKKVDLLRLIQNQFKGHLGYRLSQDTYYYGSTSFERAGIFLAYFDTYSLLSSKYTSYRKWRNAYKLITLGKHLTPSGLNRIIKIKDSLNRHRV
jgi:hypothetical protein